jgi:hypothetical protein
MKEFKIGRSMYTSNDEYNTALSYCRRVRNSIFASDGEKDIANTLEHMIYAQRMANDEIREIIGR